MPSPTPLTYKIVEPFGASALPADITLPIPVPTRLPGSPGRASYDDGFPAANFLATTAGGIPPSGKDFNGLLYTITQYLAYFQAGQRIVFDAATATAIGGYPVGAVLQSASTSGRSFVNFLANNTNDPDSVLTGWMSTTPVYSAAALAGTNDVVLPGYSDYIIDIDTTSGARTITGFVAQREWQKITLCTTGVNTVQYNPLTGSSANNQIRLSTGGIAVLQNDSVTFQHVPTINKWVQV